jgi:GTP-binding protein YchF
MDIGIIGLPLSGKTALWRSLTAAKDVAASFAPGARVESLPARVLDERLEVLAKIEASAKTSYVQVNVHDVTGMISGAGGAREVSAEVLGKVRAFDLLAIVLRAFENDAAPHPLGSLDPARDLAEVESELILADLEIVERRIERLVAPTTRPKKEKEADEQELAVQQRVKAALEAGKPARAVELSADDLFRLRSFQYLTAKPVLAVLNIAENDIGKPLPEFLKGRAATAVAAKTEAELLELDEAERAEMAAGMGLSRPAADLALRAALDAAGMAQFFTIGPTDAHAWLIKKNETAVSAAGKIHKDIGRGFIRAEIVGCEEFVKAGGYKKLKGTSLIREEGKDYPMKDGDLMNVRFSA